MTRNPRKNPRHKLFIKEWRQHAGRTQRDVAMACETGENTVSYWESGGRSPHVDYLPELAELFGCTIDQLFHEPPASPKGSR